MRKPYICLTGKILVAIRKKALEIPVFKETKNGAIRILTRPLCNEANDWIEGTSIFTDRLTDIVDLEKTYNILPGGSHIITGVYDGVEQNVDCYAYSALKIAHCSLMVDKGIGLESGLGLPLDNLYLTEDNGYAAHYGAICVEINRPAEYKFASGYDKDHLGFLRIFVCVSGAKSEEDRDCAFAAIDVIRQFFRDEEEIGNSFVIKAPSYNDFGKICTY